MLEEKDPESGHRRSESRLGLYRDRMQEIARRVEVINAFLHGNRNALYLLPTVECIYLQLRNILELIATASLVVNEEAKVVLNEAGRRKWHAGDILKAVEEVNPNFYYPQPVRPKKSPIASVKSNLKNYKGDYLTRARFTTLYDLCSKVIHTPPFDPKAYTKDCDVLLKDARRWVDRIQPLLYHHRFMLAGEDDRMYVGYMTKDGFSVTTFVKMKNVDKNSSLEEFERARAKFLATD